MIETSRPTDSEQQVLRGAVAETVAATAPQLPDAIRNKLRAAAAADALQPTAERAQSTAMAQRMWSALSRARAGLSSDAAVRALAATRTRAGALIAARPWKSISSLAMPLISPELRDGLIRHGRRAGLNIGTAIDSIIREVPKSTAKQRDKLLEEQLEAVALRAKQLGLSISEVTEALRQHWKNL